MPSTTATLQTPPGRGGIAVIVLAGPQAEEILARIFRPYRSHRAARSGALQLGHLVDDRAVIDEAVLCRTDRGAEINIHGGPVVAQAALQLLAKHGVGIQPAGSDEAAQSPLARPHPKWNNPAIAREMLAALALARSALVVSAVTQQWSAGLSALARSRRATAGALRRAAGGWTAMRRLLEPAEVVLVGPPNCGKSTLANALVGRQVSVVHALAGTTRDWVRELALLEGIPLWLTDTAGIWSAPGGAEECSGAPSQTAGRGRLPAETAVDAEAVRRARHRAEQADLVVLLGIGRPADPPAWLHARLLLRAATQCDIAPAGEGAEGSPPRSSAAGGPDVAVSAHTGAGLNRLAAAILDRLGLAGFDPAAPMAFTARQAHLLAQAADCRQRRDPAAFQRTVDRLLVG